MGWTFRGSNPGRKDKFIASPKRPDLLREPTRDLFKTPGLFPWAKQLGAEVTRLYLVTKLRMGGAMPTFPLRVSTTWT